MTLGEWLDESSPPKTATDVQVEIEAGPGYSPLVCLTHGPMRIYLTPRDAFALGRKLMFAGYRLSEKKP